MRTFTPPRMHVVRKEEKEGRLTAFIADLLANAVVCDVSGLGLTVLARSHESPVLKALAAHAAQRGRGLRPVGPHYRRQPAPQALWLGYAALSAKQLRSATVLLGRCLSKIAGQAS